MIASDYNTVGGFLMSVKLLSEEQISLLAANPNVRKVTPKSIQFSDRFKLEFIERYDEGIHPIQIFRDAGFDVDSIGRLRFKRAYANWLHKRGAGKCVASDKRGRPLSRALAKDEIIARQQATIDALKQENEFLRQIRRLERRHQPSKSPSTKNSR